MRQRNDGNIMCNEKVNIKSASKKQKETTHWGKSGLKRTKKGMGRGKKTKVKTKCRKRCGWKKYAEKIHLGSAEFISYCTVGCISDLENLKEPNVVIYFY